MKTRPVVAGLLASVALTLLMILVTQLSAAEPDAVIRSTFDTDAEGWEVLGNIEGGGGPLAPDHEETGGNPGGYIRVTDQATGPIWYWSAPRKFEGNQSANYGGALSFDLYQLPDTTQPIPDRPDRPDVILRGQGINLEYDTPYNPNTTWTHYSVPLSQDGRWVRVTSGVTGTPDVRTPATNAQIQTVLGNVGTLRIRGEYRQEGAVPGTLRDTGGLDNVVLAGPGEGPPTPTATTGTTVPSPTATTMPSPTATTMPSPTVTTAPISRRIYLPLVVK